MDTAIFSLFCLKSGLSSRRPEEHASRLTAATAQGNAATGGLEKCWMKLETEPVREPRQVVEDPDDVRDLQAPHLVKAERAQHLPVRDRYARRVGAQFLSNRA